MTGNVRKKGSTQVPLQCMRNTKIITDTNGDIVVLFEDGAIVRYNDSRIVLDNNSRLDNATILRMNHASVLFNLCYFVYVKDGNMFAICRGGNVHEFDPDGTLTINR